MYNSEIAKKNDILFWTCNRWIHLKIMGKEIADYLLEKGIQKVAVYGGGELGIRLMEDLYGTGIKILAGIDRAARQIDAPVEMVPLERDYVSKWENADAVIITSVYYYNDILKCIRGLGYRNKIIALNDILMDM